MEINEKILNLVEDRIERAIKPLQEDIREIKDSVNPKIMKYGVEIEQIKIEMSNLRSKGREVFKIVILVIIGLSSLASMFMNFKALVLK